MNYSDRAVHEYADKIWYAKPCPVGSANPEASDEISMPDVAEPESFISTVEPVTI